MDSHLTCFDNLISPPTPMRGDNANAVPKKDSRNTHCEDRNYGNVSIQYEDWINFHYFTSSKFRWTHLIFFGLPNHIKGHKQNPMTISK